MGLCAALVILVVPGALRLPVGADPDAGGSPPLSLHDSIPLPSPLARDPRVLAVLEGFGPLVDSVHYLENDVVFQLPGGPIHFQDGRLLSPAHLEDSDRFHSAFYLYSLRPLTEPPPPTQDAVYSTDMLEALFGKTETEIRAHGESMDFLDHKVFVNTFCADALQAVEREIRLAALTDPAVSAWVSDIEVAYSFIDKEIAGSGSRSHHSWGLALDLVPTSYGGKQAYWRWSRVFNRSSWHRIPAADRWSPPQLVIDAFEGHGFVWGGKWSHFDAIHFEYRPEILAYSRMTTSGS